MNIDIVIVGADDQGPVLGHAVKSGDADGVLTALDLGRELEVVGGGAALDVDGLTHDHRAARAHQIVALAAVRIAAEIALLEIPGADPDRLAGLVEGFVDLDVDAPTDVALEVALGGLLKLLLGGEARQTRGRRRGFLRGDRGLDHALAGGALVDLRWRRGLNAVRLAISGS